MSLSSMISAFGKSSQSAKEEQKDGVASDFPMSNGGKVETMPQVVNINGESEGKVENMPVTVGIGDTEKPVIDAKPWINPAIQDILNPGTTNPEIDAPTEPEVDIPDGIGFVPGQSIVDSFEPTQDPAMKETMLAELQKDVNFSYDEETKTMMISGGEISQHTLDALRGYMELSDGEFDDANIVVGQDVTFKNSFKKDVRGEYYVSGPTFGDMKCKSIDIQSQNITNAYCMFASTKADIIKVADQPNLEAAKSMFSDCDAKLVSIGEFPESVYGDTVNPVFLGCSSVVVNKDMTDVIYSPKSDPLDLFGDRREKVHTEEDSADTPVIADESSQSSIRQYDAPEYDPTFGLRQNEVYRNRGVNRVQQSENELGVAYADFAETQTSVSNEQMSPSEVRNRNASSTFRDRTFDRVEKAFDVLGTAARDAVDSQDKGLGE